MSEPRLIAKPVIGWPRLPSSVELGYTHGIAVDSQDRIFIFNMSHHAVVVLDSEGNYLFSWGEAFARGAHGLHLSREANGEEFLYLTDIVRHLVAKYTLDGRELLTISAPPLSTAYPSSEQFKPTDVSVAPNGDIYVVDGYGEYYIHRYDCAGTWLSSWGGRGSCDGQFQEPHGLWIDTSGAEPLLYVADRRNQRFPCFTLDGELLRTYIGDFLLPCDLVGDGNHYYIPDLNSRVTITDAQFRVITHIGENPNQWVDERWPSIPESEWKDDQFISPHALCLDNQGNLLVVEWVPRGRISKWQITYL
ncbi:NHL repeat-containing protein [Paenibacillus alba]|uniref:6-bladed beta-propeller n=1 Tax=Paenibacillus alba TaxID=1197127 RepID=A0ABU6G9L4_9BACL|nr:hypothetical protein [Paenibacillus alba]MEC0229962.1 hypothetical protein [Paenibacillus alba]